MEKIIVCGGNRLSGEINILSAKNTYLPILAACVHINFFTSSGEILG